MRRRRQDERHWLQYEQQVAGFEGEGAVEGRPTLIVIHTPRQFAQRGMKAYGSFPPRPEVCALWLPGVWCSSGTRLIVTGHFWTDIRATHHREVVFWVDALHVAVDPAVARGWERHSRRLERRARRRPSRLARDRHG